MLYLRLEIWPGGDKAKARLISEARIHRISSTTLDYPQDYGVVVSPEGGFDDKGVPNSNGLVFNHPYEKSIKNVWALVVRALQSIQ